jgi:N-acetylglucosamine-6-phosphate deacetylase
MAPEPHNPASTNRTPHEASPFVDLQVNGYAGVDFNADDLSGEALHRACKRLQQDGVAGFFATVITDSLDAMTARLARLSELREQDEVARRILWGLHIEGPFISREPGYVGAHPPDAVIPADPIAVRKLLDAAGGLARIVTLAPECDESFRVTRLLADQAIIVSAGHTNASLDQLRGAIDAGLTMFTHLGNACPANLPRHDNIIQRVLNLSERLWISFIADGVHIPPFALWNYLKCTRPDRTIVVSDAIAAAGLGPGRYSLGRREVQVGDDLAARSEDGTHLVGSAITMRRAAAVLRNEVGLSDSAVKMVTACNPQSLLSCRGTAGETPT